MIQLRRRHQTQAAATGVKTKHATSEAEMAAQKKASLRQDILRQYYDIMKEYKEYSPTSGLARAAHWKSSAPGGRIDGEAPLVGNMANAAVAATAAAKTVR
jgi:hypothetical protein